MAERQRPVSQRNRKTTPPRHPTVELDDLSDIGADDLQPAGFVDYIRLSGADLTGRGLDELVVQDSAWDEVELSDASLRKARFADSRLGGLAAATLRAAKAELRNCEILRSRFGFVDLAGGALRTVRFEGCKFGFLDLSRTDIADLSFDGCVIEEIDLSGATAGRIAFSDVKVGAITTGTESARDVDLRGAEIGELKGIRSLHGVILDQLQVVQFADMFARQLGARIG